jgi:hypothetical protein
VEQNKDNVISKEEFVAHNLKNFEEYEKATKESQPGNDSVVASRNFVFFCNDQRVLYRFRRRQGVLGFMHLTLRMLILSELLLRVCSLLLLFFYPSYCTAHFARGN